MGILKRFGEIMSANINAILEKAEDPAKMVELYQRKLFTQLDEVKNEISGILAEESRSARVVEENEKEVAKYSALADKAIDAQNDEDAVVFLEKVKHLEEIGADLKKAHAVANDNAVRMRKLHDKIIKDIAQARREMEKIKATEAAAKAQETLNKIGSSIGNTDDTTTAIGRMKAKSQDRLDRAYARAGLDSKPIDAASALESKYSRLDADASVIDELEWRKALRSAKTSVDT